MTHANVSAFFFYANQISQLLFNTLLRIFISEFCCIFINLSTSATICGHLNAYHWLQFIRNNGNKHHILRFQNQINDLITIHPEICVSISLSLKWNLYFICCLNHNNIESMIQIVFVSLFVSALFLLFSSQVVWIFSFAHRKKKNMYI